MSATSVPAAGTTVYVTAVGIKDYAGSSITRSYRIFQTNITKLVFVVDDMVYTGRELEPKAGVQIHVYATASDARAKVNEITDAVYTVDGYTKNINSGTGTVTVRGLGIYGGTKACNFKIIKKGYTN